MNKTHTCPITGNQMEPLFSETVLGKYRVQYFLNPDNGLIQAEDPYWLDEAYAEAICDTDTGLVARNILNTKLTIPVLEHLNLGDKKLLDIGGGYGLFARMLRDAGYDCYTTDKYCTNLFAKTFEPDDEFKANALFAFEVMEHIPDPYELLAGAFSKYGCKTIILSTEIFEHGVPDRDWWYFAFETGQHITFYTVKSLQQLAEKLGCRYFGINRDTHLITDMSDEQLLTLYPPRKRKVVRMMERLFRKDKTEEIIQRESKTNSDHLMMRARLDCQNRSKVKGAKQESQG